MGLSLTRILEAFIAGLFILWVGDLFHIPPITDTLKNYSISTNWFMVGIFVTIGFLGILLIIQLRKKSQPFIQTGMWPEDYISPLRIQLTEKYGQGWIVEDEEILRSIYKEKDTIEEICTFTNLSYRDVYNRLNFMEQKGALWEGQSKRWVIDDDGLNRFLK